MTADVWTGHLTDRYAPGRAAAEPQPDERYVSGGTFILDAPKGVPAVWGSSDQVAWAKGEPLLIVGPAGVGKTTLAGQLIMARVGFRGSVLGMPVAAGERVLYLACDRPAQVQRALARLVTANDREVLDERLVIWKGPPPADFARHPDTLIRDVRPGQRGHGRDRQREGRRPQAVRRRDRRRAERRPPARRGRGGRGRRPAPPAEERGRWRQAEPPGGRLRVHVDHGRRRVCDPAVGRRRRPNRGAVPPQAARRAHRAVQGPPRPRPRHQPGPGAGRRPHGPVAPARPDRRRPGRAGLLQRAAHRQRPRTRRRKLERLVRDDLAFCQPGSRGGQGGGTPTRYYASARAESDHGAITHHDRQAPITPITPHPLPLVRRSRAPITATTRQTDHGCPPSEGGGQRAGGTATAGHATDRPLRYCSPIGMAGSPRRPPCPAPQPNGTPSKARSTSTPTPPPASAPARPAVSAAAATRRTG